MFHRLVIAKGSPPPPAEILNYQGDLKALALLIAKTDDLDAFLARYKNKITDVEVVRKVLQMREAGYAYEDIVEMVGKKMGIPGSHVLGLVGKFVHRFGPIL